MIALLGAMVATTATLLALRRVVRAVADRVAQWIEPVPRARARRR